MSYNLLVGWSLKYKGTSQRNSYCFGVGRALEDLANEEKDKEEQAAIQTEKDEDARRILQEQADEQERLNRFNPPNIYDLSDDEESDDAAAGSAGRQEVVDSGIESPDSGNETGAEENDMDEDANDNAYDNNDGGFDTARLLLSTLYTPEPDSQPPALASSFSNLRSTPMPSSPTTESISKQPTGIDGDAEPSWSSHTQLIAYRNTREKMAEDFLKESGIKLSKGQSQENQQPRQGCLQPG